MKRGTIALLAMFSMAALVAGGCASNETVKKEEPVASTVKSEPVKVAPAKTEPVKAEPVQAEAQGAKASAAIALETIYFDFDKSDLRKDARDVLYKNAEMLLKTDTAAKIRIEGNCDERGSAEYNLALGERRAKSAQKYLQTLGVKADRISVISYGKEKPAVDGHDEAAWSKNRRDDFVIVK